MYVRLHNTINALLLWLLPFSCFISMPAKSTAWLIWALAVLLAVSLAERSYMPYPGMVVQLRIACARCHAVLCYLEPEGNSISSCSAWWILRKDRPLEVLC